MTAHGSDNMASQFPESFSEAKVSEINEINEKSFSVFQGSVAISLVVGLDSNRRVFLKTEYKHKKNHDNTVLLICRV